jgi:hypothetical protein
LLFAICSRLGVIAPSSVKDLIDAAIHRFDFSLYEIDEFVFLGMVVDYFETFIKMLLNLEFIKRV